MSRYLIAFALALAIGGTPAMAASPASNEKPQAEEESPLLKAFTGDDDHDDVILEDSTSRKDVREVTLPQPTYGNATPHPFCDPASPVCP